MAIAPLQATGTHEKSTPWQYLLPSPAESVEGIPKKGHINLAGQMVDCVVSIPGKVATEAQLRLAGTACQRPWRVAFESIEFTFFMVLLTNRRKPEPAWRIKSDVGTRKSGYLGMTVFLAVKSGVPEE